MKGFTERKYKGYGISHNAGSSTFEIYHIFADGTFDYRKAIKYEGTLKSAKQYIDAITK